ncbi:polysialyltransferase family glycosyltransferase [Streptomyces sp. NPDC058045]|uniref:polysialyltransferase family glycosyltransferase n=1 Tax=Streptomyces sp. NPDC058045 TaxID=3346311 RepID=UPI0036EBF83A
MTGHSPTSPTSPTAGHRTTRVLLASTLYGAATLAAAVDAGCFDPVDRSVLLIANNAANPETTTPVDRMPGFEQLRGRFDELRSWNAAIAPFHPGAWSPRTDDLPLWERYLRLEWGLGDDRVELVVESIQVEPALAVTRIFTGAPVDVYADGLMSYGPTRNKLDPLVGTRIRRLLHLDLVPGLTPLLLTEFDVAPQVVPAEAFLKVLAQLADATDHLPEPAPATPPEAPALLLGQYLSALDILDAAEEEQLHLRMLRGAVALGHRRIVFKPHPTAPARSSRLLEEEAARSGVALLVLDAPVLAEVLYQRMRPALVVGCFSTALLTASTLYGLPVARVGTELLLERLTPYQNSNRVPVTLVDALLPELADRAAVEAQSVRSAAAGLGGLVTAVGYAMQPRLHPELRPDAEAYLSTRLDAHTRRYFKRRRLTALGLPGAVPAQLAFIPRSARLRRAVRRARTLKRSVRR